jgi:hypothetical protein
MTIQQAEQLIRDYQRVLPQGAEKGSRRNPSLLPAPKEQLMTAIKLEIAQLFFINSLTDDLWGPLVQGAMFLDSFNDIPLAASSFIESMQRRRKEIDAFYLEVLKLDRTDAFYWQRVYTMLGITFDTKKSSSFLAGMKERLRFGQKSGTVEEPPTAGTRQVGRLAID